MPWAPPVFPGLGPALLRSILIGNSVPCDIFYGNLLFSKAIDGDGFFEQHLGKFAISELAFTPYYFDYPAAEAARRLWQHAQGSARDASRHRLERYEWLVDRAGRSLTEIYDSISWDDYDIVGFSVMMQQTVPSLALARMIKRNHPHVRVIFGGPNCSPPMGEEMLRCFPEIDYIVEGEADAVITPLVHDIRRGDVPTAPGVLYRGDQGAVIRTAPGRPLADVDSLPIPDYEPFFAQLDLSGVEHVHPYLQMETSRGCWWGEKHHCSFCSLEDALMTFRTKSEDRLVDEIMELSRRHQYTEFFPTDSIISHRFYTTLLPRLARLRSSGEYDFTFFFEIKANIRPEHASSLRAAGVNAVQPGIESFSDHILDLMDKGTTAVRQIQCLKVLAEQGIVVNWNMIYRNPNETIEDYLELISVIPYLHHLPPLHEEGLTPMLLMRFSPYFERPLDYGIRSIRPAYFYQYIFPDEFIDVAKLAFYFDFDHSDHENEKLQAAYVDLRHAIEQWRTLYRKDSLVQLRGPGFVNIVDRRASLPGLAHAAADEVRVLTLEGLQAQIFSHCDQTRTVGEVIRSFQMHASVEEIVAFLDDMVNRRLIYRAPSGQLITLPLRTDVRERAAAVAGIGEVSGQQLLVH